MAKRRLGPITRATGLGPLPRMVAEYSGEKNLHRTFNTHGLGLAAVEQRDLYLPHRAMLGVFEQAAKQVGMREFGLRVGLEMPFLSFGLWAEYCVSGETLGQGMLRVCDAVRYQHNRDVVVVEYEDRFAVFRVYPVDLNMPVMQHSDHLLFPMLRLVQYYLGANWTPAWFELNYRRDPDAHEIEALLPAPVRFGKRSIGIAIPAQLLGTRRLLPRRLVTLDEVHDNDPMQHFEEPLRSVTALAMLRLAEGKTDIEGTAALAGIGTRTLQRHLNNSGVSYRSLIDQIRTRRAEKLLRQTDLTITQIALALGYSEHANFTRAFSRWTGQSPLQYRQSLSSNK